MAQKYYNSAETAKILGKSVEEVKKMLERRELHGYRDGADWKFKVEDIDRLAAPSSQKPAAEQEGGDVLLSEVALGHSDPGLSGTVIGMSGASPIVTDSDIRLAESDIQLGTDSKTPITKKKGDSDSKGTKFEELDLTLEEDLTLEDSKAAIKGKPAGGGSSVIELGGKESDDELVLGGGSTAGSDVTIGGDSGISLVDPSDSGLSLETPINLGAVSDKSSDLGGSDLLAAGEPSGLKTDDDFLLTPLEETADTESSESGSQIIALEAEGAEASTIGAGSGISMAAMLDEDLSAQPALELGAAGPLAGVPVLGGQPVGLAEGVPLIQPSAGFESSYTGFQIAGLAACTVILMLCGMMMYDLLRNQWSWQGTYTVNSGLMDTLLRWLGMA
jgi:hypothetical protein